MTLRFAGLKNYIQTLKLKSFRSDITFISIFALLNFLSRFYRFKYPIYEFRQTQTAFGVRSILRNNMSIFDADIPVLGPPWKIPLEFPIYQYFSAVIAKFTGSDVVYASLFAASLIFMVTGIATFYLIRMSVGSHTARIATVLFYFSSFGLFHGTSVRIDFTSVFFILIAFIALIKFLENPRNYLIFFILIAGSLGSLTKITTAIPWLIIGALPLIFLSLNQLRIKLIATLAILLTFTPTFVWNSYADSVKSKNPHTRFLMSKNLYQWNFGTLKQRTDMKLWRHFMDHFFGASFGIYYFAFIFVIIAIIFSQHQRLAILFTAIFSSGPLIFSNLYLVHDYYAIAVFPALIFVVSLAIHTLCVKFGSYLGSRTGVRLSVLATLFLVALSWTSSEGIENMNSVVPRELVRPFPEFDEIKEFTNPDDNLLVVNPDWDPTLLFLVDRKGLMLRPDGTRPEKSELGTIYRFVYWEQIKPNEEDWKNYFPTELKFKSLSENFFEIYPIEK